jgi:hypothetical protein
LKNVQPGSVLDFNYFVAKIEPILATPGADGKACVFCHASHVIFRLHPPTSIFTIGVSEETGLNAAFPLKTGVPGTRSLRDGVESMAAPSQSLQITVIGKHGHFERSNVCPSANVPDLQDHIVLTIAPPNSASPGAVSPVPFPAR